MPRTKKISFRCLAKKNNAILKHQSAVRFSRFARKLNPGPAAHQVEYSVVVRRPTGMADVRSVGTSSMRPAHSPCSHRSISTAPLAGPQMRSEEHTSEL